jgi:hypothetical protein
LKTNIVATVKRQIASLPYLNITVGVGLFHTFESQRFFKITLLAPQGRGRQMQPNEAK